MSHRSRSTERVTFAVGRIKGRARTIVHRCAWCRRWLSQRDRIGWECGVRAISHGMCDECATKWDSETPART